MTTIEARFVRFLASVTSEAEARLAAAHGADIIDCKDPSRGALGALPHETVVRIRRAVPAGIPVSATIGDLPAHPEPVVTAVRAMAATGCDIVKIGLFPGGDVRATIADLGDLASSTALVAVMIADGAIDLDIIPALAEAGFIGVMLDTAAKDGRTLRDHQPVTVLQSFVAGAHAAGLFAGLAGSLRLAQVPDLLALGPDVLGFRGALCHAADRKATLVATALEAVRNAIPHTPTSPPPSCRRHVADMMWGRPGGGDSRTSAVGLPPTPDPSPQVGGERALETTP